MTTSIPARQTLSANPMSLRLEAGVRERLGALAARQKRSAHALALEAIAEFVTQKEAEDQWNKDALAALTDYRESGLHATHLQVDAWLATWGTPTEQAAPACRV